ncbi:hypothetical protein PR048_013512 [Dryococelus australis]|uniref:Uncharacterized protein n=1 Tax=Dryococelus australis TaxID=614101 RepID=A0ABQ9HSD5_9NEOP|nr:hypothetical protein PR048_013512 [Dryococelus australis]
MVRNYVSKRARPQPSEETLELAITDVRDKKLSLKEAAFRPEPQQNTTITDIGATDSSLTTITLNKTPEDSNRPYNSLTPEDVCPYLKAAPRCEQKCVRKRGKS